MKKIKILAFYRGKIFETRGTPIRIFNLLSRLEKETEIELSVFSWDKSAPIFHDHHFLSNNHLLDIKEISAYAKKNKVDVIIGYTASALYYTIPLKFLTHSKISFESHGFIEDEALMYGDIGRFKYYLLKIFFGLAYWLCDFVMTSDGPSVVSVLKKYNKKTLALTGGANLETFRPDVSFGTYIKKDSRIIIGYAGNARIWQGVDFLVAAFKELLDKNSNFRLALLLSEKKDFGNNVEVFGPVSNEEVSKFLVDCDILVIPRPLTLVTKIGYPSKLTEYLAMGKAVVGSNVGDMDKIIQSGENGLIYTADNREELIKCLLKLKDKNLREKLGANGRKTAAKMSWDSLIVKMVDYMKV
jgi:glycosyltransferase involved in cell wall biosynthesis